MEFDKLKSLITEDSMVQNGTKLEISRENISGKTETVISEYLETLEKESTYETSIKEGGKYDVTISYRQGKEHHKKELHFIIDWTAPKIVGLDEYDGKYLKSFIWNMDKNDAIQDLTAVEAIFS